MKSPYRMNRKKRKALKRRMKRHDIFRPTIRVDVSKFTAAMDRVQRSLEQFVRVATISPGIIRAGSISDGVLTTSEIFGSQSLIEAYNRDQDDMILNGDPNGLTVAVSHEQNFVDFVRDLYEIGPDEGKGTR